MKIFASRLAAALAFLLISASPFPALADTFKDYRMAFDQGNGFYGMDDAGNVVFTNGNPAYGTTDCQDSACYFNYHDGLFSGTTYSPPTFVADNGTPCKPSVAAGVRVLRGVCNDGRTALVGWLTYDQAYAHVYAGSDPLALVGGMDANGIIYMNARGDIVWDDAASGAGGDHFYEAIDQTTSPVPEPGGAVLLGTGLIVALAAFRRRIAVGEQQG